MTIFCLTYHTKTTAIVDYLGRATCRLCGEPVKPVVFRPYWREPRRE